MLGLHVLSSGSCRQMFGVIMKYSCDSDEAAVNVSDEGATTELRSVVLNNDNNNFDVNGNNNLNNNARFVSNNPGTSKAFNADLYSKLCSYENLELAWKRARKHKTLKPYVVEFEKNFKENLLMLRTELLLHSYRPLPLKKFILRDPKTRVISKSDFRDRIVHHAICNVIEPLFDNSFIHDSYANRKGKGVLKAINRFDYFNRKCSQNYRRPCFVLKADIKHYFDTVDHEILISILERKIMDARVIWLIRVILSNHKTRERGKGMPLGNLTSQFFANVYLNELDQYVKHFLKAKHYIRYVDDFVILNSSKIMLACYKHDINNFLNYRLALDLHPEKSKIVLSSQGICFLGFRNYDHHKLLKKSNLRKIRNKILNLKKVSDSGQECYGLAFATIRGWLAYSKTANSYSLRQKIISFFEMLFPGKIADVEINRWLKLGVSAARQM